MQEHNLKALGKVARLDEKLHELIKYRVNSKNPYKITKTDYNILVKNGYIEELSTTEMKYGYGNTTKKCDAEEFCISHKLFHNGIGNLGYYLIFEHNKKVYEYIYGYRDGCFYPFFYRLGHNIFN